MKYKNTKIVIIGTILLAFLCMYVPRAAYTNPETPSLSSTYVPEGLIAMWSGTLDSIPDGWILCDGNSFTPNTSDRFIYNTDGTEDAGAIGGDDSHSHGYTQVPLHDHGYTGYTDCSHSHSCDSYSGTVGVIAGSTIGTISGSGSVPSSSATHSHTTTQTGLATCNTEEIEDVFPPYYALAVIKKVTDSSIIPAGIIMIWTGAVVDIPQGWAACNGSQSTPDLEERFIRAVTDENPGGMGGNFTHSHTYTEMPLHSHTTVSAGGSHSHSCQCVLYMTNLALLGPIVAEVTMQNLASQSVVHSHSISPVGQPVCETEETHHSPPYTTVAFIMNTQETNGIPTGCISLWADTVANIPIGWGQCDGTGETHDLRNKFLKGISVAEPLGTSAGTLTHTHVYTEVPFHNHAINTHNMAHTHQAYQYLKDSIAWMGGSTVYSGGASTTSTSTNSANHRHNINPTGIASPITQTASNLPPYIELTFIQQISPMTTIDWVSPAIDDTILFSRAPTVQFNFEYTMTGLGDDVTLYLSNGSDFYDAGSVWGETDTFIDYLDGDVIATFYLYQGPTELTSATRSFTFTNNRDPTVEITSPNGGETISGDYLIECTGSDLDGDQIHYQLEYNREDTGWILITAGETGTSYNWDSSTIADSNSVKVRVIGTDGFNGESCDECNAVFTIDNSDDGNGNGKDIPGYNIAIIISLLVVTSLYFAKKRKK